MKSLLTKLDRALVAVKTGQHHADLPLASVKEAVRLLSHANSVECQEMAPGDTLRSESIYRVSLGRSGAWYEVPCARMQTTTVPTSDGIPSAVLDYVRRETQSRSSAAILRRAVSADIHDTIIKPRDPATVRGTPRDTRWIVDDVISDGKITNKYSGSASDYRLALRDLKSGKASDARQGLLALSADLPKARVAATAETRVVAISEARAQRRERTADVMSDEQRRKQEKRRAKRAKRKLSR